ncbi:MAG: hypothetical protein HRU20_22095 [Pseudomonadales bacterium]|nr:hypothetical protein [Pseudomonadales bacterium]
MQTDVDKNQLLLALANHLLNMEDNPMVVSLLNRIKVGVRQGVDFSMLEQDIEFTLDAVNELEAGSKGSLVS